MARIAKGRTAWIFIIYFLSFYFTGDRLNDRNCEQSAADWESTGGHETLTSHYLVGCLILIGCALTLL